MNPNSFELAVFTRLGINLTADDAVFSPAKRIIITGGWRAGKSTRAACRNLRQVLRPAKDGLLWLLGPDYNQCREEFRYLLEWTQALGIYVKHSMPANGSCTLVTKTGWTIVTKSAKYPERLGSVAPDGITLCEPGQMAPDVYAMSIGRLAQKNGWLMAAGTLEADDKHAHWMWYEDLAREWLASPTSSEQAYTLPSWTNTAVFPGGENDPKILDMKANLSDYVFKRKVAGIPAGVEHACFMEFWMENARARYWLDIERERPRFVDGAMGVDYGSSLTHPSTVVVIMLDHYGRYWIRDLWMEVGGSQDTIAAAVENFRAKYGIHRGRVDPKQAVLAQRLGFQVANGAGASPTDMRIGVTNGLIWDNRLFFDANGPNIELVWNSMKNMRRVKDNQGRLVYNRPLGDDPAQAVLYCLEELHGIPTLLPTLNGLGGMRETWTAPRLGGGFGGRL